MKTGLIALGLAFVTAVVFSWPLAPYADRGIASSSANIEKHNVRAMIPGDHLQFMYHMWLAQDTVIGKTPLFYNLYEFNRGDDQERYEVRPYYLPFSLFFTVGSLLGGRAVGWNLSILLSLWLTCWVTWRLAYRFARDEWASGVLAALAIAMPFQWITLLGGSPTGFGMLWVPVLLYGLDVWIGDRRFRGAALAGVAVFFAEWSDTHVFFFNVLISPFWAGFVYLYRYGWHWPKRDEWLGWLKSGWLLAVFFALTLLRAWFLQQNMEDTAISGGRATHEVALFSHGLEHLFRLNPEGDGSKIYVGVYAAVLLGIGTFLGVWSVLRRPMRRAGWALLGMLIAILGVVMLSTGVENPLGPRAWGWLTRLVPPYGMIRQPDKIYCLLPAFVVVGGALAWRVLATKVFTQLWGWRLAALVLVLPMWLDYQYRLNPTVCLLDDEQGAYAAVQADAEASGFQPLALVLPLWPGNSHYGSLYQHYVSLYRIRMVNGYRPTAREDYIESVFNPYESMNSGYPLGKQLDDLLDMGVTHVILHEDAFPEKVSSFPVGVTLANLLKHPRMEFLAQDGPVWSFRILAMDKDAAARMVPEIPAWFPVRVWNWANSEWPDGAVSEFDDAFHGTAATVDAEMKEPVGSRWIRTAGPIPMDWHVRVKGHGRYRLNMVAGEDTFSEEVTVATEDWEWKRSPVPGTRPLVEQTASVEVLEGRLTFDAIILLGAGWEAPDPGASVTLPASAFFRAGYTLEDGASVRLRRDYDPATFVFYGRHLYLKPGHYRVTMRVESDLPSATEVGRLVMRPDARNLPEKETAVLTGTPVTLLYTHPDSRFFYLGFEYNRLADVTIRDITIENISRP